MEAGYYSLGLLAEVWLSVSEQGSNRATIAFCYHDVGFQRAQCAEAEDMLVATRNKVTRWKEEHISQQLPCSSCSAKDGNGTATRSYTSS